MMLRLYALMVVFLVGMPMAKAEDDGDLLKAALLKYVGEITSYQYTVKEFSQATPEHYMFAVYRESQGHYYYSVGLVSPDPQRAVPGDEGSWDGSSGMLLLKKQHLLLINNKPYPLSGLWQNIHGLFFLFRFLSSGSASSSTESPQLGDLIDKMPGFLSEKKGDVRRETKEGNEYFTLTMDGGIDSSGGRKEAVKIKAYFSLKNGYPMRVESCNSQGKLVALHEVTGLKYYAVEGKDISIPYPDSIKSTYYSDAGSVSNVVMTEYTGVEFDAKDIANFQVDPAEANQIYDEGKKKIVTVPK